MAISKMVEMLTHIEATEKITKSNEFSVEIVETGEMKESLEGYTLSIGKSQARFDFCLSIIL